MSTTHESGDPAPPRRRWKVIGAVAAAGLVAAVVSGIAIAHDDDDAPPARLTVAWGGSEGHPSCEYDAKAQIVVAKLKVEGTAPAPGKVIVTVTAYADENTSEPVGSRIRSVQVEGTMDLAFDVTIPVSKKPHVDADGEGACKLAVEY